MLCQALIGRFESAFVSSFRLPLCCFVAATAQCDAVLSEWATAHNLMAIVSVLGLGWACILMARSINKLSNLFG